MTPFAFQDHRQQARDSVTRCNNPNWRHDAGLPPEPRCICGHVEDDPADEPRINRACVLCRRGLANREGAALRLAQWQKDVAAKRARAETIRCPACRADPGAPCPPGGTYAWGHPIRLTAAEKRARYEGRAVGP